VNKLTNKYAQAFYTYLLESYQCTEWQDPIIWDFSETLENIRRRLHIPAKPYRDHHDAFKHDVLDFAIDLVNQVQIGIHVDHRYGYNRGKAEYIFLNCQFIPPVAQPGKETSAALPDRSEDK
jgi:hypothetical protein